MLCQIHPSMKFSYIVFSVFILQCLSLTSHAQRQHIDTAFNHLEDRLSSTNSNLSKDNFKIIDSHISQQSGVTHVYFIQTHNGIEIYNAISNMAIDKEGNVVHFNENFINLPARDTQPRRVTPSQAVINVAGHYGQKVSQSLDILRSLRSPNQKTMLFDKNIAMGEIVTKLEYMPVGKELQLVWSVVYEKKDDLFWWDTKVDIVTGEIIKQVSWTVECNHGKTAACSGHHHTGQHHSHDPKVSEVKNPTPSSLAASHLAAGDYRVVPLPFESANHAGLQTSIVTSPWSDNLNSLASPFDWHSTGNTTYQYTRGNNVWAREDRNANDGIGTLTNETNPQEYNYTPDFTQRPITYTDAAVTNLFYWNNVVHDVTYHYGFDEASGNFQNNNNGQGGIAGDYVIADAQDGSDLNNAVFSSPPDGSNARMQMYEWVQPSNVEVSVTSPYQATLNAKAASFGPAATFSGTVIDLIDASGTTHAGCDADQVFQNLNAIAGNIALIDRGACTFVEKIQNAEDAGAIAVIMCNTDPVNTIAMGGSAPYPNIPSLMISGNDCQTIRQNLPVEVSVTSQGINRDSDFDNGVIVHEYGHGVSIRLTGGPSNSGCLSGEEQMGEGWSDFLSLIFTMQPGDTAGKARGVGTYLLGQETSGNGIRPFPYSTDFGVNPMTYAYTDNPNISKPHGVGSVWCTMLWDMTWALVDIYGIGTDIYDSQIANVGNSANPGTFGGQNLALQLVIEGLKLQPCNPGFVDGRDAIIAADKLLYGGQHQCVISEAFAKRGLGASAQQGSSRIVSDNVEAFDVIEMSFEKSVDNPVVSNSSSVIYELRVDALCAQSNISFSDSFDPAFSITAVTCPDPATSYTINGNTVNVTQSNVAAGKSIICSVTTVVNAAANNPPSTTFYDKVDANNSAWSSTALRGSGQSEWTIISSTFNSPSDAYYIANEANPASTPPTNNLDDKTVVLVSPSITLGDTPTLSFFHRYLTETNWDGGFVEVSDNGGNSWNSIEAEDFIKNPYNGVLGQSSNPDIWSKPAWTGDSGSYVNSIIHLGDYKNKTVNIRFVFGQDNIANEVGWVVDDIKILDGYYERIENVACANSNEQSASLCSDVYLFVNLSPNDCDGTLTSILTNQSDVSCPNGSDGSASISTHGGNMPYSYSWSNGETTADVSNFTSGAYTLTVTDNNNCNSIIQVVIDEPQTGITIQAANISNVTCNAGNDGQIEISASGGQSGYSYSWSNGSNSNTIANLNAGQYTVTVTDGSQCSIVENYTVSEPANALSVSINATSQSNCSGGNGGSASATATGGTASYTYLWSTGQSGRTINNLSPGTYSVTSTDSQQCEASSSVTINAPSGNITISILQKQNVRCNGGSDGSITVSASGGQSGYTYVWSTNNSSATINNLSAGNYSVTATDANGCTSSRQIAITEPSTTLSATATEDNSDTCAITADGQASVSVVGGSPSYTYAWSSGGTGTVEGQLTAGSYDVTVTDADDCSVVASVVITESSNSLIANASQSRAVTCQGGSDGIATATAIGGSMPYSYAWSTGESTRSIYNLVAANYQVTISDINGCARSSSVNIAPGVNEYTLQNGNMLTGSQGYAADYEVNGAIESDQSIDGGSGNDVDYDSATCITLQPGFEVKQSSVFHAFIDGCGGSK